jgi:hypothetical protein
MKKFRTILISLALVGLSMSSAMAQINLNKIKDTAKSTATTKPKTSTSSSEAVKEKAETTVKEKAESTVAQAKLSPEMQAAIDKLLNESKRTAPKVKELCDYQNRYDLIKDWFGINKGGLLAVQTMESVKAFKTAIEARTNENREIFCALHQLPENYDCYNLTIDYQFDNGTHPQIKEEAYQLIVSAPEADQLLKELDRYQQIMAIAGDEMPRDAKVEHQANNEMKITYILNVGLLTAGLKDGDWVFYGTENLITPADQKEIDDLRTICDMVQTILRRTPPADQYDGYWVASNVSSRAFVAQKNSVKMQTKLPVPAAKMNDAALNAKMLKLAQEKYPEWGVVKVIIVESEWKPEYNALGQIVRRRINTKIIHKGGGNGYVMETLNFAQPYNNGQYGETHAYAIGTDRVAVDYK